MTMSVWWLWVVGGLVAWTVVAFAVAVVDRRRASGSPTGSPGR